MEQHKHVQAALGVLFNITMFFRREVIRFLYSLLCSIEGTVRSAIHSLHIVAKIATILPEPPMNIREQCLKHYVHSGFSTVYHQPFL
jgi:hypothetical protein